MSPSVLQAALVLLTLTLSARALPVAVTSISASGAEITGITVAGEVVLANQLVTGNLTAFGGADPVTVLSADGTAPALDTRAGLLGDNRLDTGVINPAVGITASTYTFSTPVVNRPGPDIVIFEVGTAPQTDGMQVRINATTQSISTTQWGAGTTPVVLPGLTQWSAGSTPVNLAALQSAPLTVSASGLSLTVFASALELTDFGIAAGATVSSMLFGSNSAATQCDPVLIAGITPPRTGGPVISEILAGNADGLEDEDADESDWVEIYNGQPTAVNLAGWTLSLDPLQPAQWTFPSINVPAFGYTYVFASSKNRFTNLHAHTNFNLPKSGGTLVLRRPDTTAATTLVFTAQMDDVSYGTTGGDQAKRFFETPTPGQPNTGRSADGLPMPKPVFDKESAPLTANTTLTLSLPVGVTADAGAQIRYTLNGTLPTETSPLYATPLSVTSTSGVNVTARIFQAGRLPSPAARRNFTFLGADLATNYNSTAQPFSSNLPILVLDSYGVAVDGTTNPAGDRPFRLTQAYVYDVDPVTGKASLGNAPNLISRAATHVRGQSSSSFPQKPYALEFWNESTDTDKDVELLGFPADSDWILQTMYIDKTFQRNQLMQQLMLEANGAGPGHRNRYVEVFFNQNGGNSTYAGEYRGVYLLMENIKRGNNRLQIEKLTTEATESALISGGYIFKRDKDPQESPITPPNVTGSAWNGITYSITEPSPITTAQQTWLRTYINQADTALNQSSFLTPSSPNYSKKWVDWPSFIDKQIWMETCKESDAYIFSYYYYKNRGEPIKADLMWDVDRSLGNSNYNGAETGFSWRWWTAGNGYAYFPRLFTDPEFTAAYWDRWWALRRGNFSTASLLARIDVTTRILTNGADPALINNTAAPVMQNPAARHFRKWSTLGANVYSEGPTGQVDRKFFGQEVDLLKAWITQRVAWIDTQSPLRAPDLLDATTGQPLFGGDVGVGQTIRFHNPNPAGTLYYTINGADPRVTGGATAATALTANGSGMGVTPLMPGGQSWKWLRPTSAPAAAWKTVDFVDTAWGTGNAPLGYGESGLATNISPTAPNYTSATSEPAPTYFRRTFNVTGLATYQNIRLEVQVDDGAVIYINGVEVARPGYAWPPTVPAFTTEAGGMLDDSRAETAYNQILISPSLLVEGSNTLAVEVHQGLYAYPPSVTYPNNSYSDMRFDMRINGIAGTSDPSPTLLTLTSPGAQIVRSRVKNGTIWSGLTEATFFVQTVPAAAENLVISEFNYRPSPPTPAETAAGYPDAGSFEYVELMNIHPTSHIDLSSVNFSRGITWNFNDAVAEARYLAPGGRVLIVANPAAFASRLPAGPAPLVAGTFTGALSNGGENLTVLAANGSVIKDFAYDNSSPWPTDADGSGRSLVLIRPQSNPNHNLASNWFASPTPNGTPGGDDSTPFPANPVADDNGNGFPNVIEYVLGANPTLKTTVEIVPDADGFPDTFLLVHFPRDLTAGAANVVPELSTVLDSGWSPAGLTFVAWDSAAGTQSGMTWRSTLPVSQLGPRAFIRLRSVP